MAEQDPIEKMKMAHPVDAELFGPIGAAAAHICKDLAHCFVDKRFEFMDPAEYQAIGRPSEMMCIYWREMLFRVYWAAALNLMRHQRWQAGCLQCSREPLGLRCKLARSSRSCARRLVFTEAGSRFTSRESTCDRGRAQPFGRQVRH